MASCTCPVLIVGHYGPVRILAHDCPEHGDAARRTALDAADPVDAVRSAASVSARFRVLCDLLNAESDRPGPPRKNRIREIAQAAALCAHQARRDEIASEGGRRD